MSKKSIKQEQSESWTEVKQNREYLPSPFWSQPTFCSLSRLSKLCILED